MKRLFVVIRSHGAGWLASRSMEDQEDWQAHASFMNALEKQGFVLLGRSAGGHDRGSSCNPRIDRRRDRGKTLG
jgi:hypothetical protein